MRAVFLLAVQLIVTLAKLARPGGVRSVIAESLAATPGDVITIPQGAGRSEISPPVLVRWNST